MKRTEFQIITKTIAASGDSVTINEVTRQRNPVVKSVFIFQDTSLNLPMRGNLELKIDEKEIFDSNFDSTIITASFLNSMKEVKHPVELPGKGSKIEGKYTDIPTTLTAANYPYNFSLYLEVEVDD